MGGGPVLSSSSSSSTPLLHSHNNLSITPASLPSSLTQEYTLIKMEALELNGKLEALKGQGKVFLLAATLRPETMCEAREGLGEVEGQGSSCWPPRCAPKPRAKGA